MTAVTGQNPVPAGTPFNKKEIDDALAKQGIPPPSRPPTERRQKG
jgi:hypothetical protein